MNLNSLIIPDADYLKDARKSKALAEEQIETLKQYVTDFQNSLDNGHDVGIILEGFGAFGVMQVTEISYEWPVLMIFKGTVNGVQSTLIQHLYQLNFLLTTVPKPPQAPKRQIGFTARWAKE